jgi:hypothetical protein
MGSIQPLILSFVQEEIEIMMVIKEAKKRIELFIFSEGFRKQRYIIFELLDIGEIGFVNGR